MGAAAPDTAQPDADGPTVESWCERDQRIIVTQPAAGYLYDLTLRAKLDAPPDQVYQVLRDPASHAIFRGIKATLSRTTLEDDGAGRRKLRVKHRALTRFLWLSVTFDTELFVWEDDHARTIRFTNARDDGFMRQFDGLWHVAPFTQQTLDAIYRSQQQQPGGLQQLEQQQHAWHGPGGPLSTLQHYAQSHGGRGRQKQAPEQPPGDALVTLEQALAPRVRPPGPVAHLVRGLCGRVLHNMMADLRTEVARRQALQLPAPPGGGGSRAGPQQPSLPVASLTLHGGQGNQQQQQQQQQQQVAPAARWGGLPYLLAGALPLRAEVTIRL